MNVLSRIRRRYFFLIRGGSLLVLLGVGVLIWRLGGILPLPSPSPSGDVPAEVEVVAEGLEVPWEVALAPDGRILVTERPGRVRVIRDGELEPAPLLTLPVSERGEGGLLGLALDPDFAENGYVYLYYTYESGGEIRNRVARYRERDGRLIEPFAVVDGIPGNVNHNGGRIAFGPDGKLYITTGDSQNPSLAQDRSSLAGKILRVNPNGSIPSENPFGTAVWSYGHRNAQGLSWDEDGRLYATEHGPSGDRGLCCRDEVNRIERGGNYGWPLAAGDEARPGLIAPIIQSGSFTTWAPAGAAFVNGDLYFAALRGRHLHRVVFENGQVTDSANLYENRFGRLRAVARGPDGSLYVTTSNRDGRGSPTAGDDKLLRITPK